MAKNWDTMREEAVAAGRVNEEQVAAHKARMLAELRSAHGLTQVEAAQKREREADADIAAGRVTTYDDVDFFLDDLPP